MEEIRSRYDRAIKAAQIFYAISFILTLILLFISEKLEYICQHAYIGDPQFFSVLFIFFIVFIIPLVNVIFSIRKYREVSSEAKPDLMISQISYFILLVSLLMQTIIFLSFRHIIFFIMMSSNISVSSTQYYGFLASFPLIYFLTTEIGLYFSSPFRPISYRKKIVLTSCIFTASSVIFIISIYYFIYEFFFSSILVCLLLINVKNLLILNRIK